MPLLSRCGVGPQWHCCVKATASSLCTKRRGRPPQTPGDVTNRAFEGLPRGFWVGRWTSSGGPAVVQQCLLRPFTRTAAWRRPTRQQWGHCQPAAVEEDPLRACFIRLHPARMMAKWAECGITALAAVVICFVGQRGLPHTDTLGRPARPGGSDRLVFVARSAMAVLDVLADTLRDLNRGPRQRCGTVGYLSYVQRSAVVSWNVR